jgi:hypothetical protein
LDPEILETPARKGFGDWPALMLSAAVVGVAAGLLPVGAGGSARLTNPIAHDVSYPQCRVRLPTGGSTGIVGVTAGRPFSTNACLKAEYGWASSRPQPPQLYMNTSNPGNAASYWTVRAGPGPRSCTAADLDDPANLNCAYNFGWNSARDAVARALGSIGKAAVTHAWWLDAETANSWNGTTAANAQDLQGSIDYLRSARVPATGFYSTSLQWSTITGGYQSPAGSNPPPGNWIASASSAAEARSWCSPDRAFSDGAVYLVQYLVGNFDGDYLC